MSEELDFYKHSQCMNVVALVFYYEMISERLKHAGMKRYTAIIDAFVGDFEPLAREFYGIMHREIPYDYDGFKALLWQEKQFDRGTTAEELVGLFSHITEGIHQQTLILVQVAVSELHKASDRVHRIPLEQLIYYLLGEHGIVEQLARFELCFESLVFSDLYEHGLTFVPEPAYVRGIAPDFLSVEFDGQSLLYKDPNLVIRRIANDDNSIPSESAAEIGNRGGHFTACMSDREVQYFREIIGEYIKTLYPGEVRSYALNMKKFKFL